ncbi:MAG: metallophosphoesterase family protein [Deltaproteobacteria bacterium]|nr:metallophosphoesterase family protein [Deltaproteobacteria bacterium]
MLIASVSDLHTDFPENRTLIPRLAAEIYRRGARVIVLAGDVSHRDERIDRALRAFGELGARVVYVPGNHDLWFKVENAPERPDLDTWHRYHQGLRVLAERAGAHYLPSGPLRIGDVALVGSCGWYDYSFVLDPIRAALDPGDFGRKRLQGWMWSDARFIAFRDEQRALMADTDVARRMECELTAQIREVDADDAIRHVVAVTHHQAFSASVRRTGTLPWEFFNAFMGSEALGRAILTSPKMRVAIYGHTHTVGEQHVSGIRVFGTPLGYPRERVGLSPEEIIQTRIGWIDTVRFGAPSTCS